MTIADANTVIDAFERCFCRDTSKCDGCYQEGPGFGFACVRMLARDVLAILKRVRPVAPRHVGGITEHGILIDEEQCGACGERLGQAWSFCPRCGAAIERAGEKTMLR